MTAGISKPNVNNNSFVSNEAERMTHNTVILTHSVYGGNYGCILQAYALQKVLIDMGHTVATDAPSKTRVTIKGRLALILKPLLKYTIMPKIKLVTPVAIQKTITTETSRFSTENMNLVDLRNGARRPRKKQLADITGYVVGSDQVLRSAYSDVTYNLLDFTGTSKNITRLAYAASFGTDSLSEYNKPLLTKSTKLAKKFDSISVREDTGIELCKKNWGIEAVQLVDPTMLLARDDYIKIINNSNEVTRPSSGDLFAYILDRNDEKQNIIDIIKNERNLTLFEVMPKKFKNRREFKKNPGKYVLPTVSQWLKSFADAKYVVTDSFHGCVFSIIFNKPFIAIGNEKRGLTRFTSLLKIFGLESRLILEPQDLTEEMIKADIDWNEVNIILQNERKRSFGFLQNHLGDNK